MADSSTDASSTSPNRPQTTIDLAIDILEEDERNCFYVVYDHVHVLLLYVSGQIAQALETFYT